MLVLDDAKLATYHELAKRARAVSVAPQSAAAAAWPGGRATAELAGEDMDYRKKFVVEPGGKLKLSKLDPSYKGKHETESDAKKEIDHFRDKLVRQQLLLYAEHKHSILVVLQALDAGGKDGTIKHVFTALNPQGASVASFKQPTPVELAHDFLWRIHPHAPGKGEIVIV